MDKYYMSDGKVYECVGIDAFGRLEGRLTNLKEIPKDEPLPKPEIEEVTEEKPKRGRKAK